MRSRVVTPAQVRILVLLLLVAIAVALIARRLRVPYTLALVLVGFGIGFVHLAPGLHLEPNTVLFIFLPVLLFEGALSIDARLLLSNWLVVLLLAVPGLIISLIILAVVLHLGANLPWLVAALLGAIISPTDPVAVVALLRQLGMPSRLRTIIEGESLFNDGVGASAYTIVLGLLVAAAVAGPGNPPPVQTGAIALQTIWLILGGPVLGLLGGWLVARLMAYVDDHLIETSVSFGLAYGIYLAGDFIGTSGLLATVCAGLVFGSYGRRRSFSEHTQGTLTAVWEFVGYVANSLLFLLVGIQIGAVTLASAVIPIAWAVLGLVVGRAAMIFLLLSLHDSFFCRLSKRTPPGEKPTPTVPTPLPRTWRPLILLSGLRGALSLALALSLASNVPDVGAIQSITFGVVLVTLLGQGIGMRLLLPRWPKI